jgi:hypothetical protein
MLRQIALAGRLHRRRFQSLRPRATKSSHSKSKTSPLTSQAPPPPPLSSRVSPTRSHVHSYLSLPRPPPHPPTPHSLSHSLMRDKDLGQGAEATRWSCDVCSRMLTYACVCSRMLTYADVWQGGGGDAVEEDLETQARYNISSSPHTPLLKASCTSSIRPHTRVAEGRIHK